MRCHPLLEMQVRVVAAAAAAEKILPFVYSPERTNERNPLEDLKERRKEGKEPAAHARCVVPPHFLSSETCGSIPRIAFCTR